MAPLPETTLPFNGSSPIKGIDPFRSMKMYTALYGSKSYSSLFTEPENKDPAPGQYELPTGFGYQMESHKETFTSKSIAPKSDGWAKVLITKDHMAELLSRGTPGPGSYTPGYVESQASVRFGTSLRPNPNAPDSSPGPVYDVRGCAEDAVQNVKFGRDGRFDALPEEEVGPGKYPMHTQFDGAKKAKSFGISHRAYDKVKMPGSERQYRGRTSPGPGNFQHFVSGGRNFAFPKSNRPAMRSDNNPVGPGQYGCADAGGKTISTYSFGKPSVSARFNWSGLGIRTERWCKLGMAVGRPRASSQPALR